MSIQIPFNIEKSKYPLIIIKNNHISPKDIKIINDLNVGDTFKFICPDTNYTIKVIENTDGFCNKCFMVRNLGKNCTRLHCIPIQRKDNKNIRFECIHIYRKSI